MMANLSAAGGLERIGVSAARAVRCQPAWWQYAACAAVNLLSITIFWISYEMSGLNTLARGGLSLHVALIIFGAWALASLFLFASSPPTVNTVFFGSALFGAVALAAMFSPLCFQPASGIVGPLPLFLDIVPEVKPLLQLLKYFEQSKILWTFFVPVLTNFVVAAIVLRLLGLHLHYSIANTDLPQRPWQFTLRSLVGGTVIAIAYTMVISHLLANGKLVQILAAMTPSPRIDGVFVIFESAGIHIAVVAMAVALWSKKLTMTVGLLGLALALPVLIDPRQGGPDDMWRFHMSTVGTVLYCAAGIALPWALVGVHTTWEKPVFER